MFSQLLIPVFQDQAVVGERPQNLKTALLHLVDAYTVAPAHHRLIPNLHITSYIVFPNPKLSELP